MLLPGVRGSLQRLSAQISEAIVQDCPPELAACQVCRRLDCRAAEWLNCERRLAAKRYLEAGDQLGFESLKIGPALPAVIGSNEGPKCPAC